jgi:hypothetical protein
VDIKQVYIRDGHMAMVLAEAQAAIHLRDTGSIVRQPHWGCPDCGFRTVCSVELLGDDATIIRDTQFRVDPNVARHVARYDA